MSPDRFEPPEDESDRESGRKPGDEHDGAPGNGPDDPPRDDDDDGVRDIEDLDDSSDDDSSDDESDGAAGDSDDESGEDDDADDDDSEDEEAEDGEARPAVFVTTREPVMLVVSRLEDPRAPESSALAAFIDGRMIARSAMPPEAIERLLELELFEEPVPLGLFAYEDAPGLQCRLFALVPRSALEGESHEAEPWKESVPSFEAALSQPDDDEDDDEEEDDEDDDGEMAPFETILLGHIVRFEKDRRHPEDLAAEAVDILQRIIHGAESLEDADRKAIDDLLGSL